MFYNKFKLTILSLLLISYNNDTVVAKEAPNNNFPDISLSEYGLDWYNYQTLKSHIGHEPTKEELKEFAKFCGKYDENSFFSASTKKKFEDFIPVLASFATSFAMIYLQLKMLEAPAFKVYKPGEIKETFASIAGNQEAKDAFEDIVAYLKNPEIYESIGARPTKGILLTGAPGTGKTLIARALAGEVNCSFIYASGSEFNTKFVGSGMERVKKLFEQARNQTNSIFSLKKTPCIIFIDEIEVLARRRGTGDNYGDQSVNELLTQLDGFVKESTPIIVIAATNHPEKLDPAIIRPGRIDRTIHIDNPDLLDRKKILQIHLNKVAHDPAIDLKSIAQRTIGFTGAELAEIVQSAARITVNRKACQVEQEDLENALDTITIGIASKKMPTMQELKETAYHEAGHAIIGMLLFKLKSIDKITIIPRGKTLGVTYSIYNEELAFHCETKEEFLDDICMAFGGRAAEELMFNLISTGATSDLVQATNIASNMVKHFGMGNGLAVQTCCNELSNDMIQKTIETILAEQYQRAKKVLEDNIDKLHKLANALLEKETLYALDIAALQLC